MQMEQLPWAVASAAWFWQSNGLEDRLRLWARAKAVLHVS